MAFNPLAGFNNPWDAGGSSAALNTPAISNKPSMEALQTNIFDNDREVLGLGGVDSETTSEYPRLQATFIYCFDKAAKVKVNLKDQDLIHRIELLNQFVTNFFIGNFKKGTTPIDGKFISYYSNDERLGNLKFEYYEDIEKDTELSLKLKSEIRIKNANLQNEANYSKKNIKERGLKIICIRDMGEESSNAEKNGTYAYININDIIDVFKNTNLLTNSATQGGYVVAQRVLLHEIGHLFGLADRYQYLFRYKKDSNGCFEIVDSGYELHPIPMPRIEDVDNDRITDYQNLMFGAYSNCKELTTYQQMIILGIAGISKNLDNEEDYRKSIILIPYDEVVYTGRYSINGTTDYGIIIGNDNAKVYYNDINGKSLKKNFSGKGIKKKDSNGNITELTDFLNDTVGIFYISEYSNIKSYTRYSIDKSSSNQLGEIILNNPNCQTINLNILSNASGIG